MALSFDYKIRVNYVDTDKMGVVHNSNYFRYFEMGRVELMRHLGVSYKTMEDNGIMMPLIEQYAKYLKPAYFDEELIIRTSLEQIPMVKIRFDYKNNKLKKEEELYRLNLDFNKETIKVYYKELDFNFKEKIKVNKINRNGINIEIEYELEDEKIIYRIEELK